MSDELTDADIDDLRGMELWNIADGIDSLHAQLALEKEKREAAEAELNEVRKLRDDPHDFAVRLIELEPSAEKAKEVFMKHQYKNNFKKWLCIDCKSEKGKPCAPDCAIAELLREG